MPRTSDSCVSHVARRLSVMTILCLAACRASAASAEVMKFEATRIGKLLHVVAEANDPSIWANTQLMIDTDGDAKTGYHVTGQTAGFDVMVEGATVYRFGGSDPVAWDWKKTGTVDRIVTGKKLTLDIDANTLPDPDGSVILLLRALSPDYKATLATSSATRVDLAGKAASADTKAAPPTATATGLLATAAQAGPDLVVKVTAAAAADLNTVLIFFDTDGDASTGFSPPADPRFGFEAMIQGGSLSRHAGGARDAWSWKPLGTVKQTVTDNSVEIRFNASLLKSTKLKMSIWQMSADWQNRTDFSPKAADGKADVLDIPIDATKLRAALSPADIPIAPVHANASIPPRERFAAAKSYVCYYGGDSLGPLSHLDAAILHIPAQTPDNVKQLSKLGVVTIGYLSVGEDETLRPGDGSGFDGKASWYFDKDHDGKPDENGTWGSYYANAGDAAWRADRIEQAKKLCNPNAYGFDGIFLDTIETVDTYPESRDGMIKLVEALRSALPDKVIVINRGFSLLKESAVSGNIDGLMFESFTDSYDFSSKQYVRYQPQDMDATRATMVSTVTPAMKQYKLQCLALDYCEPDQADRIQEAFDRAATYGMLPAVAPISLDMVYDTAKVVGHPDEKYLTVQATPESMQIKLADARNGFPAGTIIQPSSCFMGYSPAVIVDGATDHTGMYWAKAAWASAEEPGAGQQLLVKYPDTVSGGTLKITFAFDNKAFHASRDFSVDISADGSTWETVAHPTANTATEFSCQLPAKPIKAMRIVQSPGGGSADRPDLMWVQQIKRAE